MSRFVSRVRYYARDAADEFRHSPGVNFLAAATLTAVLFVAALMLLLLGNVEHNLQRWRDDLRIAVYLRDDVGPERRDELRGELESMAGVSRVEYIDREEALSRFRDWYSELAEVPAELDVNPLPESLEVFVDARSDAGAGFRVIG